MTTSSEVDLPPEAPPSSRRAQGKPARSRFASLKRGRRYVQPTVVVVGIALLGVAYYLQARSVATISEGSSQALQAWDMVHGNPLLRGWSLSDVSFYTTELPEYALVELVRGLNTWTIPTAAAVSYFGQVVLAGFLARGRARGFEGWVRGLIAVGIMLAPPLGPATALLMASPDHVGTHVPLLLIYLVLDRVRPRWWVPVVVLVLLTWGTIGDPLVIYEGALPVAGVCVLRVYRRRGPWRAQWYDLSLAAAAGLSAGLARVILKVIEDHGGFYVRTPIAAFGTPGQVSALLWTKVGNVLLVFGADFFGVVFGRSAWVALLHLIAVVLVFWAVAAVVRRLYVEEDQVTVMLAAAFVVVLVAYVLGTKPDSNEVVGLLPIGAVLAGRVLGPKLIGTGLVPVLSVVFVVFAVFLGANATWPAQVNPNQAVGTWLRQHGYTYGLAGYWNASAITVETGGAVTVRPVRTYQASVVTTNFQSDSSWYDANQHYANFVITTPTNRCGDLCLTKWGLKEGFGPPAQVVEVGDFEVLIYDQNLLTSVTEVTWCGNAWAWKATGIPTTDLRCTSSGVGSSNFGP